VNKLPEGWKIETIGNFCDILDNQRVPISSENRAHLKGDISYYGANGIQGYINDFIFNETLVLLAEDGGHFNDYQTRPIAYMVEGKSWINNHTHVLRAKNGENHFLYYSLVHKDMTSFINGGTRAKLNRGELVKIPLIIPPLEEQKKIAEILSTVDQKIAFVDNQIEETELLKKGLMQKLLTEGIGHDSFKDSEVGRIPVVWEVEKLENVSDFITKGATPTTYGFDWEESGIPFLRSECVTSNGLNLKGAMFISPEANAHMNRSEIRSGDLLITITGNVGRVILLDNVFKNGNINQHIARIRISSNNVEKAFIYQYLSQDKYRMNYYKITTGQAYPQISLKQVRDSKFPLPPIEEQKQIAEILSTADEKLETLKIKKESFEELKKGLMQKLLTGEVRV